MFVIFGMKKRPKIIEIKKKKCKHCKKNTFHQKIQIKNYFTLFFIPLIPFGSQEIEICNACGYQYGQEKLKKHKPFKERFISFFKPDLYKIILFLLLGYFWYTNLKVVSTGNIITTILLSYITSSFMVWLGKKILEKFK